MQQRFVGNNAVAVPGDRLLVGVEMAGQQQTLDERVGRLGFGLGDIFDRRGLLSGAGQHLSRLERDPGHRLGGREAFGGDQATGRGEGETGLGAVLRSRSGIQDRKIKQKDGDRKMISDLSVPHLSVADVQCES
jgi:hypothetical protein